MIEIDQPSGNEPYGMWNSMMEGSRYGPEPRHNGQH